MAKRARRKYQWLPCVIRFLETTWPRYVSYDEIITNATLGGVNRNNSTLRQSSRVCPTKTSFTSCMRGDPRFQKVKVTTDTILGKYRETVWRLRK